MEFGGVGNMPDCFLLLLAGRERAATVAKVSRPVVQKLVSRGWGMSTEAVMPARAMAMLEVFWVTGAMSGFLSRSGCFSVEHGG